MTKPCKAWIQRAAKMEDDADIPAGPRDATGPKQPTQCPLCGTVTDPVDFHLNPQEDGGIMWTYECMVCQVEKPCYEWVKLALEKLPTDTAH